MSRIVKDNWTKWASILSVVLIIISYGITYGKVIQRIANLKEIDVILNNKIISMEVRSYNERKELSRDITELKSLLIELISYKDRDRASILRRDSYK